MKIRVWFHIFQNWSTILTAELPHQIPLAALTTSLLVTGRLDMWLQINTSFESLSATWIPPPNSEFSKIIRSIYADCYLNCGNPTSLNRFECLSMVYEKTFLIYDILYFIRNISLLRWLRCLQHPKNDGYFCVEQRNHRWQVQDWHKHWNAISSRGSLLEVNQLTIWLPNNSWSSMGLRYLIKNWMLSQWETAFGLCSKLHSSIKVL